MLWGQEKQIEVPPVKDLQEGTQEAEELKGAVLSEKIYFQLPLTQKIADAVVDEMIEDKESEEDDYFNTEDADDSPEVFRPAKDTKEIINTLRAQNG